MDIIAERKIKEERENYKETKKKPKRNQKETKKSFFHEIIPVFRPPALGGGIPAFTNAWVTSEASFIMRYALNMFGLKICNVK